MFVSPEGRTRSPTTDSGKKGVSGNSFMRVSHSDLESLMATLEVSFVTLTECLVSPGWRLELGGHDDPGIHYNLTGMGRMIVGNRPPIDLLPHTLVIVPAGEYFHIEAPVDGGSERTLRTVNGKSQTFVPGALHKFVAGADTPQIIMICGYFCASYGASVNLFATTTAPIVEQFDATDQLDQNLKTALAELIAQEVGAGAMSTSLMKLVLVTLLRRSLKSIQSWVERFSLFSDPHIARAFADMAARPGADHSIESLAKAAALSRSAFMARFTALFGRAPMTVLRDLRMRQATVQLTATHLPIEQIARNAGYASRTSFIRAFRKNYGCDPSGYRASASIQQ
jgi:AraC family transcriptional activator of mtrCDE